MVTEEGWPVDVDLCVDSATGTAIEILRVACDASFARALLFRARRAVANEKQARAKTNIAQATQLAPTWDRVWLGAARVAPDPADGTVDDDRLYPCATGSSMYSSKASL